MLSKALQAIQSATKATRFGEKPNSLANQMK